MAAQDKAGEEKKFPILKIAKIDTPV